MCIQLPADSHAFWKWAIVNSQDSLGEPVSGRTYTKSRWRGMAQGRRLLRQQQSIFCPCDALLLVLFIWCCYNWGQVSSDISLWKEKSSLHARQLNSWYVRNTFELPFGDVWTVNHGSPTKPKPIPNPNSTSHRCWNSPNTENWLETPRSYLEMDINYAWCAGHNTELKGLLGCS